MSKVSVIVPIYNVEKYIERSLHSLFVQTLDDLEYVFVDDASTDKSILILSDVLNLYPKRRSQVKIIHHKQNLGVTAARTSGIKAATGEYIILCDPDDFIDPEMYEKLYNQAIKTKSDITACYHLLNNRPVIYKYYKTPQKCLRNLYSKKSHYVHIWSKLVKSNIIKTYNILPESGINFEEDLNFTIKLFHYAQTITLVREPLYHYCIRENSLSTTLYKKFDTVRLKSLDANLSFLRKQGKGKYKKLENYLIYKIKFSFPEIFKNEKDWFNWHKECHKNIINFDEEPIKTRIILYVALKNYKIFKLFKKFIPSLNHIFIQ